MSLTPGTRLGAYEVTAAIGAGGMGEVYRATDTKLKRDVAIKVLPGSMAADPERLARFQREAEVLAALNHPHIAAIYGLEETGSGIALVMELVDGVTLGELIATGTPETERVGARSKDHDGSVIPRGGGAPRGLNIDDALAIARQIADALEAAHERGIVHRDLKPANIKVRPDGTVKVLDFGLAKALGPDSATGSDVANSPTITTPAMTQVGMILGTAAYMAPEQARGRAADKRADIWAFGCVLFEMLTGRRAFPGDDVTDTLAAVVKLEPDWTLVGADVPARVRKVLGVCLQKDPRQRGGDIAAIRLALDGAFDTLTANAPAAAEPRSGRRAWLVTAAAFVAGGLVVGGAAWSLRPTPEVRRVSRFEIEQLDGVPLAPGGGQVTRLALSPDGTKVAFLATPSTSRSLPGRLLLRRLDGLGVTTLYQGAAANPFFSPDGNWVAFFAPEGQGSVVIRKVAVTGGPAITIGSVTDASTPHGADWGDDDTIVFGMHNRGLWRMPGAGGTPEPLAPIPATAQEGKEAAVDHREWPAFLPGARALLYSDRPSGGMGSDESRILVRDLDTGEERMLVSGGSFPQYARTGHLVYAYEGTLRTVGFDLERLDVVGTPRPVLEGVVTKEEGAAEFRVSRDGSLVYLKGGAGGVASATLVWRDRSGNETPFGGAVALAEAGHPRLSPDGTRLALSVAGDIWVYFVDGRPPIRLTSGGDYLAPLWSPDGQRLVVEGVEGDDRLWSIAADGSDSTPVEVSIPGHFHPHGWSDGGRDLIAVRMDQGGSPDIVRWPLTNPAEITPVLSTPAVEGPQGASLSPDGHWLAYASNQTGSNEIWVRPYPGPGAPIRVSPNGGRDPVWARNGRELYYFSQQSLMAVAVRSGPTLSFDVPAALFQATPVRLSNQPPSFDVGGDGRFVMLKPGETDAAPEPTRLVVVLNWSQELLPDAAAP